MIKNNYNINFSETLNLAVLGSAVHGVHLGPQATIMSLAASLNGTTINSAADVELRLEIVGGAVLAQISLLNGMTAGQAVIALDGTTVIPTNSVLRVSVIVAATVAAGSASITLGLSNG